ncbi:MAG TPA: AMP-binding protein, partial [Ramlibacter sp.]|nr:AMP-binding protein [Ramlibacter sp.]
MSVSQARDNYARMHAGFGWQVPQRFNIAQACCGRWAQRPDAAQRIAIRAHGAGAGSQCLSYRELQRRANATSQLLVSLGVRRGDRVAIVMPQRFETAIAYMAVFQLGAVAMPLSILFGPDALEYRLQDSEAVVALCDGSSIANVLEVRAQCPALRTVIGIAEAAERADIGYEAELARHGSEFTAAPTKADEGAVLIYTS